MKKIMWVLVYKSTGKRVPLWINGFEVVGFNRKKDLLKWAVKIKDFEEIKKIEFEY